MDIGYLYYLWHLVSKVTGYRLHDQGLNPDWDTTKCFFTSASRTYIKSLSSSYVIK